jgi:hypothetical protein
MKSFGMVRTALVGASLLAFAASANAASITFTEVQPAVKAPQGAVFTLPQFNPALGTLTQVDLTWVLSASINAQISQNGNAGSAYVDGADIKYTFNAPQVLITALNQPIFDFPWFDNTPSPIVIAPSGPAVVGGGQQVNQVNWSPYTGSGTFNVTWAIEEFDAAAGPVWVGTGGFTGAVLDARLGGYNFSVTYNYEEAATPEPASLARFGLAGAALTVVRRRRRS